MNPRMLQNVAPYSEASYNVAEPRATDRPYLRLAYECPAQLAIDCHEIKTVGNLMCWRCYTTLMRSAKEGDGMMKATLGKLDVVEAKLLLRAKFGDGLLIHDEHLVTEEDLAVEEKREGLA